MSRVQNWGLRFRFSRIDTCYLNQIIFISAVCNFLRNKTSPHFAKNHDLQLFLIFPPELFFQERPPPLVAYASRLLASRTQPKNAEKVKRKTTPRSLEICKLQKLKKS